MLRMSTRKNNGLRYLDQTQGQSCLFQRQEFDTGHINEPLSRVVCGHGNALHRHRRVVWPQATL